MNAADEGAFRRLLRWYPRAWRELNGDVFIATLLEAADAEGRTHPTPAERRSAVLHGIGARINRRLAITLSVTALVLSAALSAATMFGFIGDVTVATLGYPILVTFVVPVLTGTALIAAIRDRGWISDTRALWMIGFSVVALALAGLASVSWGLGFDAADTGTAPPALAQWWGPSIIAGIVTGAIALALLADSLLHRTTCPAVIRNVVAVALAVVSAPIIGLALLTPALGALVAMATIVMSLTSRRSVADPIEQPIRFAELAPPAISRATGSRAVLLTRASGLIAALAGTAGAAYALTGALWTPAAVDATQAMQYGIVALLISAIPLLVGFGMRIHLHTRVQHVHTWGPITLAGISLILLAIGYLRGPEWEPIAPWFVSGSLTAGIAVAWWITPRVPLPRKAAVLVGTGGGLLYAAIGGFIATPLLAFTVPIWALILLIRTRNTHPSESTIRKLQISELAKRPSTL